MQREEAGEYEKPENGNVFYLSLADSSFSYSLLSLLAWMRGVKRFRLRFLKKLFQAACGSALSVLCAVIALIFELRYNAYCFFLNYLRSRGCGGSNACGNSTGIVLLQFKA
jgi:hypothetical protein